MTKKIFCIGGATVDFKLKSNESLQFATSNPVTVKKNFGGVARNIAENLAHWTSHIHLQTIIGDDAAGKELINSLIQLQIDTSAIIVKQNISSAHYYAILNHDGELMLACADMQINDSIDLALFMSHWNKWNSGDLIFLDTNLTSELIVKAIEIAKKTQTKLCIDPVSTFKAKKLGSDLAGVFLLKPNRAEAECMSGISIQNVQDALKASRALLNTGVENLVITLGKEGFIIANHDIQKHVINDKPSKIKDVSGAGDAFMAGILYGLQQDADLFAACEYGTFAAQLALQSDSSVIAKERTLNSHDVRMLNATIF